MTSTPSLSMKSLSNWTSTWSHHTYNLWCHQDLPQVTPLNWSTQCRSSSSVGLQLVTYSWCQGFPSLTPISSKVVSFQAVSPKLSLHIQLIPLSNPHPWSLLVQTLLRDVQPSTGNSLPNTCGNSLAWSLRITTVSSKVPHLVFMVDCLLYWG